MKLKKRKKSDRMRGSRTHGWAMKKHKGSGNRGGKGFAGTGKRADQKKTYVLRYHYPYFGKQGYTSRGTAKNRSKEINLYEIESSIQHMIQLGKATKITKGFEVKLPEYKILGEGELHYPLTIHAKAASASAIAKVEKLGGKIILKQAKSKDAI